MNTQAHNTNKEGNNYRGKGLIECRQIDRLIERERKRETETETEVKKTKIRGQIEKEREKEADRERGKEAEGQIKGRCKQIEG